MKNLKHLVVSASKVISCNWNSATK